MSIVQRFTLRHLLLNRRRTLITLVGVALSMAMLTAVTGFVTSFKDAYRDIIRTSDGAWSAAISDLPAHAEAEAWMVNPAKSRRLGETSYHPECRINPKTLSLREFDSVAFEIFHFHLLEGAWPQVAGEVVVEKSSGFKMGEIVEATFTSEDGISFDGHYEIVGLVERDSGIYLGENPLYASFDESSTAKYTLFFDIHPISARVIGQAREATNRLSGGDVIPNSELLRIDDPFGSLNFLYVFGAILLVIIAISSVMVIYNAFTISAADRTRQVGILRSIGATRRQLFQSVLFEASILAAIGIPLGLLTGTLVEFIALELANPLMQGMLMAGKPAGEKVFHLALSWQGCLLATILALLSLFISAWQPARRMANVSSIEAIRLQQEIKLSRKQVRTPRLVATLFGFEGALALKTLQRYRSKYRATILSLITSIVLFLAVTSFSTLLQDSTSLAYSDIPYNISGYLRPQSVGDESLLAAELRALSTVRSLTMMQVLSGNAKIPEDRLTAQSLQYVGTIRDVDIHCLDDATFEAYCQQLGLEAHPETVILLNNSGNVKLGGKATSYSLFSYAPGEQLTVILGDAPVTIALDAVREEVPFGVTPTPYVMCLVTSRHLPALTEAAPIPSVRYAIQADEPEQTALDIENLLQEYGLLGSVHDIGKEQWQNQNIILFIRLFTFGFVAMLSLIGVTSVIGAISTTINLRRREFAMLRSVGLSTKGFEKMLYLECLFYGFRSLLWGLPLGLAVSYWLYNTMQQRFDYAFEIPYLSIAICIAAVFCVVFLTMLYSGRRASQGSIVDTLRLDLA